VQIGGAEGRVQKVIRADGLLSGPGVPVKESDLSRRPSTPTESATWWTNRKATEKLDVRLRQRTFRVAGRTERRIV